MPQDRVWWYRPQKKIAASLLALIAVDSKRTHQEFSSETAICYTSSMLKQLFVAKINSGRGKVSRLVSSSSRWSFRSVFLFVLALSLRDYTAIYIHFTNIFHFWYLLIGNIAYVRYMTDKYDSKQHFCNLFFVVLTRCHTS